MRGWLLVFSLACACEARPPAVTGPPEDPSVHERAVENLERDVERATLVAEKNGRSAIVYARAASAHMALARLAARPEHFSEARRLLDRAYALAPDDPPRVQMARLYAALHRPKDAMAELEAHDALEHPLETRKGHAFRLALQAQLAHELGQYARATDLVAASLGVAETATGFATLARDRWLRGDYDGATEAYRRTEAAHGSGNPESRAWVKLQLGLMALEQGSLRDAEAAYRAADALYPGYWLVQEHLAEVLALRGRPDEARAIYQGVTAAVDVPELHAAMAELCRSQRDDPCVETSTARALAARARWSASFPAMVDGHDVRRSIADGDPEAVARATANVEARPNAESWMLLAQAELKAGDREAAEAAIGRALETPVRSPELRETAAAIVGSAAVR